MNNPTIDQKRATIAKYMGLEQGQMEHYPYLATFLKDGYWISTRKLKYDTLWEWLMPVIIKISKTPLLEADGTPCTDPQDVSYPYTFGMPTDDGKRVMFRFKAFACYEGETLIEAAFEAVYEFIEFEKYRKGNG